MNSGGASLITNTQRRYDKLQQGACARWRSILAFGLFNLVACVAPPDFADGPELAALMEAYKTADIDRQSAREQRERDAIRLLRVEQSGDASQLRLSVDLENADLDRVLRQILHDPRVAYRSEPVRLRMRVSARFQDLPLADGLNLLLADSDLAVQSKQDILTFVGKFDGRLPVPNAGAEQGGAPAGTISQEIVLEHLQAAEMAILLSDLYSFDSDEVTSVTVGSIPELNAIYLSGPSDLVADAARLVKRADRPVAHVIIEAMVVNIDTSSVESMGIQLTDLTDGNFSATDLIPSQTGGNLVASFSELAANSTAVTATINLLAARNVAEVIARPYIATQSTKVANIQIVDDQFARVDTTSDDSSIITTDSITAGISMQITPIVMGDDSIRMDLSLEDSRFGATAGDIIVTKQRSTASTSMIVQSGQTIVIGGLNSRYRISENTGLPWLRHVPLLNLFGGEQGAVESRVELVVYLTPYIWMPGLETPMPFPGTPEVTIPNLLSLETGSRVAE